MPEDQENIDYVICQICGKRLLQVGNLHLRTHNITTSEYCSKFPEAKTICTGSGKLKSNSRKAGNIIRWGKPEEHVKQSKLMHDILISNPSIYHDVRVKMMLNINETNRERWNNDPEYRERISKIRSNNLTKTITSLWADPVWRDKSEKRLAISFEKQLKTDKFVKFPTPFTCKDGTTITMKSSLESRFASFMDSLNIHWEYETYRFKYTIDSKDYTYIVDFFLPDFGVFVEVKSKYYYERDKEVVDLKIESVRLAGFDIYLMMESNWNEMKDFVKSLSASHPPVTS